MIGKSVGGNIKKFRISAGLSQRELAKRVGKSESYIGDAENAKNDISLLTLEKISTALKVPIMALIDDSFEKEKSEFDEFIKLRIYNLEDRMTVTTILVKNGYTVGQTKQKRTETGKVVDYFLAAKLSEENADTAR